MSRLPTNSKFSDVFRHECWRCGTWYKESLKQCPNENCRAVNIDKVEKERERAAWNLGTEAANKHKKTWQT